jgi:hypothetical protein
MKKILIFLIGMMLFLQHGYSQQDCDIEIKAITITTPPDTCLQKYTCVHQLVTLTNKGNVDVYDIPLVLEFHNCSGLLQTICDTFRGVLQADSSYLMTFQLCYYVPADTSWFGIVRAELPCDTNLQDNVDTIKECVDLDDIEVLELVSPECDKFGNAGDIIYPEVKIKNWSLDKTFDTVVVSAIILADYNAIPLLGVLTNLTPDTTMIYKFSSGYTVPNVPQYTITVFVNNIDNYPNNDTARCNIPISIGIANHAANGFTLEQNIPNPAKNNTQIEYNISSDGQVIFTLYNITGQILYAEKNDAASGKNKIELNTANLTNGVYYYAMEYKGERLVRKMTIQK